MSDLPIVHASHLSDVYADASTQIPRYRALLSKFAALYGGESPDLLVRSPGRVNIIGDHIDYCYFSVLPMAVESDMIMAVKLTYNEKIEVANTDDTNFKSAVFDLPSDGSAVEIDATKSDWVNYFKCGLVVGQEHLKRNSHRCTQGMKVLIDGNVPTGSGLSSSAAFVVCATLSTLLANGFTDVSKHLLTKLSIRCEQHVGVNSGGMDQSASIFGLKGNALFVSFVPDLAVKPFAFPSTDPKLSFVVANSLITSNKHETGPVNYNLRVVEVTLGALVMAKKLGLTIKPDGNLQAGTFRGVCDAFFKSHFPDAQDIEESRKRLAKMLELVDETITNQTGYTTEQVASELGVTVDEIKSRYMTKYPVRFDKLKLYARARHVFAESKRVLDFLALLQSGTTTDSSALFSGLGKLMNESHDSAVHLFENSCAELDDICKIALAAGAAGSRVTGAGWGGSSVHLVPSTKTDSVIKALTEQYYKKRFPQITDAEIKEALLVSEPGSGTTIIDNLSLD